MNLAQNFINKKKNQHQYFSKLFHKIEKEKISPVILAGSIILNAKLDKSRAKNHRPVSHMNTDTKVPNYIQEHIKMSFMVIKLTSFQKCRDV